MRKVICLSLLLLSPPLPAAAFIAASVGAHVFSFQSKDGEVTPNYYGIASQFNLGCALSPHLDISTFGAYLPAGAHIPKVGQETARLMEYGGEISWQFSDAFLALKGGPVTYLLRNPQGVEGEITGQWRGTGGGIELGSFQKVERHQSWQISLAYFYILLQSPNQDQPASRHLHQIGIQARYTFGGLLRRWAQHSIFDHVF